MENEQLILNLLKRVSILEERVDQIESQKVVVDEAPSATKRKLSKNQVIHELSEHCQPQNIIVKKRSNSEGGGLSLTYPNGDVCTALLKMSRNYVIDNPERFAKKYIWRGWHRVNISDESFSTFDFFIFSIENGEELNFFILTNNIFKQLLNGKDKDKNGNYYFYFVKTLDGKILEDREKGVNMQPFLNNWSILNKRVRPISQTI